MKASHPFNTVYFVALALLSGVFAASAQTGDYLYTGSEQTIILDPGLYDITAYGARGGQQQLLRQRWRPGCRDEWRI